jgi:MFS transporter, ACS family, tartrate transporter
MVKEATTGAASIEVRTIRKLQIRLIPFLFALYVIAFVDRINLGFAALTMNRELAITSQQFGFAAGVFFFGYFLLEVPSNLMLHKLGARVWIARILITWGTIAALTGFVQTAHQLYIARFVLGLAEAGYFPGILLYLSYWFRQREKAQAIALFLTGIPVASILGAPISGIILDHVHWLGLSSWRWLLILEGFPAIVGGILAYFLLTSRPSQAKFLSEEEKKWITEELESEDRRKHETQPISAMQTLINRRVWYLACIGFAHGFGTYTFSFWLPQLMKSVLSGSSNSVVGFLVVIPNLVGLAGMILVSRHSDSTLERRYHMGIPVAFGGIALLSLGASHSPTLSIALLCCVALGMYSCLPVFFALPSEFLTGFSAAAGIALVTSIANLGGFAGPYTVGFIRQSTGSLYTGLACAGISLVLSGTLALVLPGVAVPNRTGEQQTNLARV